MSESEEDDEESNLSRVIQENEIIVNEYEQELATVQQKYLQLEEKYNSLLESTKANRRDSFKSESANMKELKLEDADYQELISENTKLKHENVRIKRNYTDAITSMSKLMQIICDEISETKRWITTLEIDYIANKDKLKHLETSLYELPTQLDDMAEVIVEAVAHKMNEQSNDYFLKGDNKSADPQHIDDHANRDNNMNEHVNNTLAYVKCLMLEKELANLRLKYKKEIEEKQKLRIPKNNKKKSHTKHMTRGHSEKNKVSSQKRLNDINKKFNSIVFG